MTACLQRFRHGNAGKQVATGAATSNQDFQGFRHGQNWETTISRAAVQRFRISRGRIYTNLDYPAILKTNPAHFIRPLPLLRPALLDEPFALACGNPNSCGDEPLKSRPFSACRCTWTDPATFNHYQVAQFYIFWLTCGMIRGFLAASPRCTARARPPWRPALKHIQTPYHHEKDTSTWAPQGVAESSYGHFGGVLNHDANAALGVTIKNEF